VWRAKKLELVMGSAAQEIVFAENLRRLRGFYILTTTEESIAGLDRTTEEEKGEAVASAPGAPGGAMAESGGLCQGDRGQGPGDRRRMALMSTILFGSTASRCFGSRV